MSYLNDIHWLHAVNTKLLWEKEISPRFSDFQNRAPLGIEVDIRFSEQQQCPVLSHDKLIAVQDERNNNYDTLQSLCEYLLLQINRKNNGYPSPHQLIVILKLDIKEYKAARAILLQEKENDNTILSLLQEIKKLNSLTSSIQTQIWFNVDVLPITSSKFVAIDAVSPLDVGYDQELLAKNIIQRAVSIHVDETKQSGNDESESGISLLFDTFSLGWIGCGNNQVVSYNRDCCEKMMQFIRQNIFDPMIMIQMKKMNTNNRKVIFPNITFAVRASFVVDDSEARRQLRDLCSLVNERMVRNDDINKSIRCFLTFWRGRREVISQSDYEFANKYFGEAWTIDSS